MEIKFTDPEPTATINIFTMFLWSNSIGLALCVGSLVVFNFLILIRITLRSDDPKIRKISADEDPYVFVPMWY